MPFLFSRWKKYRDLPFVIARSSSFSPSLRGVPPSFVIARSAVRHDEAIFLLVYFWNSHPIATQLPEIATGHLRGPRNDRGEDVIARKDVSPSIPPSLRGRAQALPKQSLFSRTHGSTTQLLLRVQRLPRATP